MSVVRVRAVVSGWVQGVWYRESCRGEAERLGVTGWVRNRPDGAVEIDAEGDRESVEALLRWARTGPSRADVDNVSVVDLEPRGALAFEVR